MPGLDAHDLSEFQHISCQLRPAVDGLLRTYLRGIIRLKTRTDAAVMISLSTVE